MLLLSAIWKEPFLLGSSGKRMLISQNFLHQSFPKTIIWKLWGENTCFIWKQETRNTRFGSIRWNLEIHIFDSRNLSESSARVWGENCCCCQLPQSSWDFIFSLLYGILVWLRIVWRKNWFQVQSMSTLSNSILLKMSWNVEITLRNCLKTRDDR